jgi:hypothetical protein
MGMASLLKKVLLTVDAEPYRRSQTGSMAALHHGRRALLLRPDLSPDATPQVKEFRKMAKTAEPDTLADPRKIERQGRIAYHFYKSRDAF